MRLLLATLAITPLRQLTDRLILLRFRRMPGQWRYAYAFASARFAADRVLDLRGYWTQIFEEIVECPASPPA